MFTSCLFLVLFANAALAMDCKFIGSKNLADQVFHSCPGPFMNPERSYCCPQKDGGFECCDFPEFISTPPFDSMVVVGLVIFLIVAGCVIFACFMFCCVCLCRRRDRGRVLYHGNMNMLPRV